MDGAKLSRDELTQLIYYGVKENGFNIYEISNKQINYILSEYFDQCDFFQRNYVVGELDTFKRAACLMVAINNGKFSYDKKVNAAIAVDAAYKMCEKPYWNVGPNHDIPQKLDEINYKEVDLYLYDTSKKMLIDSLVYEMGAPLSYHLNLELFYYAAIQSKINKKMKMEIKMELEKTLPVSIPTKQQDEIKNSEKPKQKKLSLNIFRKK